MTGPLIVDTYSGAKQPTSVWTTLAAAGAPWSGGIIKATQGVSFAPSWFLDHWPAVKNAGGARYGVDWFRGAYHFLNFNVDGAKQAEFYLAFVEKAGGWDVGDFWPVVDVELGNSDPSRGEVNPNNYASAAQIIDCTTAFAYTIRARTGRATMLYGNGAMRDKGISDRMGCEWLWCPRYTATLPKEIYERAGWSTDKLALWQYAGDGTGGDNQGLVGYPALAPGFGKACDISVLTMKGGIDGLRSKLWAENPSGGTLAAVGAVGALAGAWIYSRGFFKRFLEAIW